MTSGRKDSKKKVKEFKREVQVRMEDGELRFFSNYSQAWAFFLNQRRAWKISWTLPPKWSGKRLRIVKLSNDGILQAGFVEDFIAQVEHGHLTYSDD